MTTQSRFLARGAGVLAAAGLAIIFSTSTAAAHVTASVLGTTTSAAKGGMPVVVFKVPNEDPSAGTVKLQVTLPLDHPVASVSTEPVPGWKTQVDMVSLDKPVQEGKISVTKAVKSITWTAQQGIRINPGEFQEFAVSMGPLPVDTDRLIMPATQTYDSGRIVEWSEQPSAAGQQEPEHPAPTIALTDQGSGAGSNGDHAGMAGMDNSTSGATGSGVSDDTARWLGGAALVVGALGLGFGAGAMLRTRKPSTPSNPDLAATLDAAENEHTS